MNPAVPLAPEPPVPIVVVPPPPPISPASDDGQENDASRNDALQKEEGSQQKDEDKTKTDSEKSEDEPKKKKKKKKAKQDQSPNIDANGDAPPQYPGHAPMPIIIYQQAPPPAPYAPAPATAPAPEPAFPSTTKSAPPEPIEPTFLEKIAKYFLMIANVLFFVSISHFSICMLTRYIIHSNRSISDTTVIYRHMPHFKKLYRLSVKAKYHASILPYTDQHIIIDMKYSMNL